MNIAHSPGSIPNGAEYDTYVHEVYSSDDDGDLEHVITDLIPGTVSREYCDCAHVPACAPKEHYVHIFGGNSRHV